MKKITISDLAAMKNQQKIVMITAYDALFARIFDEIADMILVGDSLNMSFGGKNETIGIGIDEMIYHTNAVATGVKRAFLVADMPFGSAQTPKIALKNATKLYKKTPCDAVKIEGGAEVATAVELLSQNGIAVISHIGLKPQFARAMGGFKIAGKTPESAAKLINDAKILQNAGAVMILIEGVPSCVATKIQKAISVPLIGIGAGKGVDGQVLVWSDMLGFFEGFKPKFVKRYLDGAKLVRAAVQEYANDVREMKFPSAEFEY